MARDFNNWLSSFRDSIADYGYYIDFEKVHKNVDGIKVELNLLNTLIGSKNIEQDFEKLIEKYPETLKCIPLLLAVRANEIYAMDSDGTFTYNFKSPNLSVEQYKLFMRKTGLFDLISNHIVNNLVDYATGVETGLDSNGRKNRGGHLMENLVESFIQKAGFIKNGTYFKEMYIHQITNKWNIDLSAISNQGKMENDLISLLKRPPRSMALKPISMAAEEVNLMKLPVVTKLLLLKLTRLTGLLLFGLQTEKAGQALAIILKKLLM